MNSSSRAFNKRWFPFAVNGNGGETSQCDPSGEWMLK